MAGEFASCASAWGLSISLHKTNAMTVGADQHVTNIVVPGRGSNETVHKFPYLGSIIADDAMLDHELTSRLAKASCIFGCLASPIFHISDLSFATRCYVCQVTVLSVLPCGAETWTVMAQHRRHLESFHRQCIRFILGTSHLQQWEGRLTA